MGDMRNAGRILARKKLEQDASWVTEEYIGAGFN
jgi:hypothetical protein